MVEEKMWEKKGDRSWVDMKETVNTFNEFMSGRNMQKPLQGDKWRVHLKRQIWKKARGCGSQFKLGEV